MNGLENELQNFHMAYVFYLAWNTIFSKEYSIIEKQSRDELPKKRRKKATPRNGHELIYVNCWFMKCENEMNTITKIYKYIAAEWS